MNVHALHPTTRARCDHGHFIKAGSDTCRRCGAPASGTTTEQPAPAGRGSARRPGLSLVKAPRVPVLSLVTPIPLTLATGTTAGATVTAIGAAAQTDDDATLVLPIVTADGPSGGAQRPQEPAGEEQGDIVPALPVRPVLTPLPAADVAAARAAMNARVVGLQVRVMDWRGWGDGTATVAMPDGTHIRYQPAERCLFAAAVPCLLGSHHYASIRGRLDLDVLRADADACIELHADLTEWPTAAARDLSAAFAPRPVPTITPVFPLQRKDTDPDA